MKRYGNAAGVLGFLMTLFMGCVQETSLEDRSATQNPSAIGETQQMAEELQALVDSGHPKEYYHWNGKMAEWLQPQIKQGTPQQQINTWFEYCKQKLNAGETQACIEELTGYLNQSGVPYSEALDESNRVIFELLALAYLRLGEQQNCQQNHTAQSCIVPLRPEAWHLDKTGSEKATEIYELLLSRFPRAQYQWLLNVAYMTLGKYPNELPQKLFISLPSKAEQTDFPLFTDVAAQVGLAVDGLSGGTCIDDFNNDGFLDVFATSYGMEDNVQLFFSDQKGGYINVTTQAGLDGIVSGLNCLHADYDNDGYKDILILRGAWLGKAGTHPNSLLKNQGDGSFKDVTRSSGLLSYHPTQTASWGDFDRDGNLDLFIGNESQKGDTHPCELFHNNGDGTFTEVAREHGLEDITGFVKGVSWGDINTDGWPDLYISVLGGKNRLYKNEEGQFTNIAEQAGVEEPFFSFPCWFWDVNNDGHQDLFVSGYDVRYLEKVAQEFALELMGQPFSSEKPRLFINQGDETFLETSKEYGLNKTMFSMGANFGDLDNDGFLDFYVGTGAPDYSSIVPNRMFRNVDGKRFEEVTSAGGFGHIQKGHGVAFADLDRDGDQDIYAVMGGAYEGDNFTNVLFENPISDNHWLVLVIKGEKSNRSAIGTRLDLVLQSGRKLYRTVSSGGSFGASPLQQEIGLGESDRVDTLTVHWPSGITQSFYQLEADQKVLIREGEPSPIQVEYRPISFDKKVEHHHHH